MTPEEAYLLENYLDGVYKYKHSFCPMEGVCLKPVWFLHSGRLGAETSVL